MNKSKVFLLLILLFLVACHSSNPSKPDEYHYPLSQHPILRISDLQYQNIDSLFKEFARPCEWDSIYCAYKNSYSDTLRLAINEDLLNQADAFGLDLHSFAECIRIVSNYNGQNNKLLCLANRIYYENERGWVFVFLTKLDGALEYNGIESIFIKESDKLYLFITDYLPLETEIRYTSLNYDSSSIVTNFIQPPIFTSFRAIYNYRCSFNLRRNIVANIKKRSLEYGTYRNQIDRVLELLHLNEDSVNIPCLIERAKYESEDVWIITQIWGTWLSVASDLSHYRVDVISESTYETLLWYQCQ
ncbi:hypothetical protein KAR48_09205 [bacterium]|nr:hypothetical protein [bacterium]